MIWIKLFLAVFVLLVFSAAGCSSQAVKPVNNKYQGLMGSNKTVKLEDKSEQEKTSEEYFQLGQRAQGEGDRDKALYYYVKAVEKDSKNGKALKNIGDLQRSLGNTKLAYKAYELALDASPEDIDVREKFGVALLGDGQYRDAEMYLSKVVEADPKRIDAFNGLGVIEDVRGNFQKAKTFYNAALKLKPKSLGLLNNLAYSFYLEGDWTKAEQVYIKLLSLDSHDKSGNLNYGLLLARQGKTKKALEFYEKVLPKASALNEIAYVYKLDKRYQEAMELFEMAIDASPVYFEKAYESLKQVRDLQPSLPEAKPVAEWAKSERSAASEVAAP